MKVVQETSRILKLKQVNWGMPWYAQLFLWPMASLLLLFFTAGDASTFVCERAKKQCQLEYRQVLYLEKTTIGIERVQKFDLVATRHSSEDMRTQIKIITDDGDFNIGLYGSYRSNDAAAGKLAWFFENPDAQYIKLYSSTTGSTNNCGLISLLLLTVAAVTRKSSLVVFDRDTERCVAESTRFFGLLKRRREVCEFHHITGVGRSGSLKVVGDRLVLHRQDGSPFFLTDEPMNDPASEMAAVQKITDFLNSPLLGCDQD
jgi:hypothetical protein